MKVALRTQTRSPGLRRATRAAKVGAAALLLGLGSAEAASAQTSSSSAATTTTVPSGPVSPSPSTTTALPGPTTTVAPLANIVVSTEIPNGFSRSDLPLGAQKAVITISNPGLATKFNEQMVVRFGARPDTMYFVRDANGSVGVIDGTSGLWFHTIAVLPPNTPVTYTVTWNKVCPGRWPLGVRVGDSVSWQVPQWIGASPVGVGCQADETAKPTEAPYPLGWPNNFPAPAAIAPAVVPSTTVPTVGTVAPTRTTTTIGTGTTGTTGTIGTSTSGSTSLGAPTSTVVQPTTTISAPAAVPTVRPSSPRPTTMLVCRTVNGKRTCGTTPVPPHRTTKATRKSTQPVSAKQAPNATKK